jgi:hypothetical protein
MPLPPAPPVAAPLLSTSEMGGSMARVQRLMGHADANTLMRYAHIEPAPLADLLLVLENPPGIPPKFPQISSSISPPDNSDSP